jgi:hypothetical protein
LESPVKKANRPEIIVAPVTIRLGEGVSGARIADLSAICLSLAIASIAFSVCRSLT